MVPLDRRGEWYRYHHLFGQLLRNELERSEPDVVPALNSRAMAWCIANDLTGGGGRLRPRRGRDGAPSPGWSTLSPCRSTTTADMETLEEWLAWFGEDELAQYPALAVYGAWVRVLTGRPDDAERWLALADGATSAIPLSDGSATIEPWVATLRAHMMPDGVEQALADADLALDQFSPGSDWIPTALLARGVAHALLGATDRATDDLAAVVERGLALGAVEEVYLAQAQLALLAAKQGAWGEAAQRARAAQALVDEAGLGDYASSALAHVATARSRSTRADTRMRARRSHGPTVCGRCSTTAFPG